MNMKKRGALIGWGAVLAIGAAAAVSVGATTGGPTDPSAQDTATRSHDKPPRVRTESRRIASSTLGRDYKFTLTALRSKTDPLAATVHLRVFTFQGGTWKESDRATVGSPDDFFWFPLTGRHAVCTFSTSSREPAPVTVSLLVTPSIGCSPEESFQVEDGSFVPH